MKEYEAPRAKPVVPIGDHKKYPAKLDFSRAYRGLQGLELMSYCPPNNNVILTDILEQ